MKKNYENLSQFRLSSNKNSHTNTQNKYAMSQMKSERASKQVSQASEQEKERLNWIERALSIWHLLDQALAFWCLLIYIFHGIKYSVSCKWKIWFIKPFSRSNEKIQQQLKSQTNAYNQSELLCSVWWIERHLYIHSYFKLWEREREKKKNCFTLWNIQWLCKLKQTANTNAP